MDDLTSRRVSRTIDKTYGQQDLLLECAQDFGRLIAKGEREKGLPVQVAFELAREHFKRYGAAMVGFGNMVTIEMCPPERGGGP